MNCIICDEPRANTSHAGGLDVLLTPVVKVWCCSNCIEALTLNACRNAFRERCEEAHI